MRYFKLPNHDPWVACYNVGDHIVVTNTESNFGGLRGYIVKVSTAPWYSYKYSVKLEAHTGFINFKEDELALWSPTFNETTYSL